MVLFLFQYGRIVSSEVLQGFAPGLALFSACIYGLNDGICLLNLQATLV